MAYVQLETLTSGALNQMPEREYGTSGLSFVRMRKAGGRTEVGSEM
jgi:hypothetical protein